MKVAPLQHLPHNTLDPAQDPLQDIDAYVSEEEWLRNPIVMADFSNVPTIAEAYNAPARIKAVVGPAGSGKTTGVASAYLLLAMNQPPAGDGVRYTRVFAVRNTYELLKNATFQSFYFVLGNLPGRFVQSVPYIHVNFPLPDGTRVDLDIQFLAMDTEEAVTKLLGKEMTYVFLDEVSELQEKVVWAAMRRIGRYPSGRMGKPFSRGLWMVTNGPRKNHWLYEWYVGSHKEQFEAQTHRLGYPFFGLWFQPPALLRPRDKLEWTNPLAWRPNPRAENIKNLPDGYGYYYDMFGEGEKGDEEITSYVEGRFANLRRGKVVFPEFRRDLHVIDADLFQLPPGASIGYSFDFGRTPVCLMFWEDPNGRLILIHEYMIRDADIRDLMEKKVWPSYLKDYNRPLIDWATGDPAGLQKGQAIGVSPFDVLRDTPYNLPMEVPMLGNKTESRLSSMRPMLRQLSSGGLPAFGILSSCPVTIDAFESSYVYEEKRGGNGEIKEEPTKIHFASDVADAAMYATLYRTMVSRVNMASTGRRRTRRWRLGG